MTNKLLFILLFILGSLSAFAQTPTGSPQPRFDARPVSDQADIATPPMPTPPNTSRQISGGVLNGKATSLPKPPYPAAARAVRASGAVSVQVLIDEEGNIISANAVSGHPLLRAAAVEAARGAKFSPTQLMGQPVKVTGVITYNFVPTLTTIQMGFELGFAEKFGSFSDTTAISTISNGLPIGWAEEREILQTIRNSLSETSAEKDMETASQAASVTGNRGQIKADRFTIIKGDSYTEPELKLSPDSIELIGRLQRKIRERLAEKESGLWFFELGQILGHFRAEMDSATHKLIDVNPLRQLISRAPGQIKPEIITKLDELINKSSSINSGPEKIKEFADLLTALRNL